MMINTEQIDNKEISLNNVKKILLKLQSTNNEERQEYEAIISTLQYDINLYAILLQISFNGSLDIDNAMRIQSMLLIKNIIKKELNQKKASNDLNTAIPIEINNSSNILQYLKEQCTLLLANPQYTYSNSLKQQIKDIVLILTDKFFPNSWDKLNQLLVSFFSFQITSDNLFQEKFFDITQFILTLCYSILKQFSRKKGLMYKSKFYPYKPLYLDAYVPYYDKMISLFEQNIQNFTDLSLTLKCLKCLSINDNIIIKLIEISYNHSEFHKDEKLLYMVNILFDRTFSLLKQIESSQKSLKETLHHNLFKIIKNVSSLQMSNPILFYKVLKKYLNTLFLIIFHCELFTEDTTKAVLFSLNKIINTDIYRQCIKNDKTNKSDFDLVNITTDKTPEKKKQFPYLQLLLSSPAKYRNFEAEIKLLNEDFIECFKKENIVLLLEHLIKKCPFVYKKENDNLEIEILSEIEDETISKFDSFSTNLFTFHALYKELLDSIINNFNEISMKYIKDTLNKIYSQEDLSNVNYHILDSFFVFINLLPSLHKKNIVSISDMIDSSKYIKFMEGFISKSDLILKRYIITLSKWSFILISNETIFEYINKLILFISNTKNNYVLIQSCLCLKTILEGIDKQMEKNNGHINTIINKETFSTMLKTKINWGNLFCLVTNILINIIPNIQSSELIVAMVKFFTLLIQKSHFQNNGEILPLLSNSKLIDITSNSKDEFTENVYIEMYKQLLCTFSNSHEVAQMSLIFGEGLLKKKANINSLNFILFFLRIANDTPEIKKIIFEFLKRNFNIFVGNTTIMSLQNILIGIIEEIILFDILDINDISNFLELVIKKYIPTIDTFKSYNEQLNQKENQNISKSLIKNQQMLANDLCDSKAILLTSLNSILLFCIDVKGIDLTMQYQQILRILFIEVGVLFGSLDSIWVTSLYISNLIQLIERICLYNMELFKEEFSIFLNENSITIDLFMEKFMRLMMHTLSNEVRKINVLFLCKIMSLMNYDFLNKNAKAIFDICSGLVYIEYSKKIGSPNNTHSNDVSQFASNSNNLIRRSILLKQSNRKKKLIENDNLFKYDLYSSFVEVIRNICITNGTEVGIFLIESDVNDSKNKEIFGI